MLFTNKLKIRVWILKTNLVGASVIEDRLEILEINVAELVQPEVVDGGRCHRKVVLLETDLMKSKKNI